MPVAYQVFLTDRAERDLDKLPEEVLPKAICIIAGLADDPRPRGCRKIGPKSWRIRLGDYRILYEVDDDVDEVVVYRVRHRGEAYR
ncbi:MAG: type II toxin-antitoxin system RelE family toxin [Candidatus Bipolaricaulia bacterium]